MEHHPYDPDRKVPGSDLSARDEFRFWVPVSVLCLLALVAVTAAFPAERVDIPKLPQILAPVVGWLIGSALSPLLRPRRLTTPSWIIAAVALVLVAICAIVFPPYWTALGRGLGGFVIGLAGAVLALRALEINRS